MARLICFVAHLQLGIFNVMKWACISERSGNPKFSEYVNLQNERRRDGTLAYTSWKFAKSSPLYCSSLYMHKAIVWTNNKIDAECKNLATEYDKTQQVYISLLKKKIARIEKSPWRGWNALSTSKKRNFHLDNKMLKIGRHERLWCHSKMFLTYTLHGGLPLFFLLQCDDIFTLAA